MSTALRGEKDLTGHGRDTVKRITEGHDSWVVEKKRSSHGTSHLMDGKGPRTATQGSECGIIDAGSVRGAFPNVVKGRGVCVSSPTFRFQRSLVLSTSSFSSSDRRFSAHVNYCLACVEPVSPTHNSLG